MSKAQELATLDRMVSRLTALIKIERNPEVRFVLISQRNSYATKAHLVRNNGRFI